MPPTENLAYRFICMNGRPVPYKAKDFKLFEKAMTEWRLENLAIANAAKQSLVSKFKTEQKFIRIDRYFAFPKDQFFHSSGLPKRMDASNRIKCLDDLVAKAILGLDDQWFVSGFCEKVLASPGAPASVTICLTYAEVRTEDDVLDSTILSKLPCAVQFQRAML